jgi:hypothetical protein
MVRFAPRPVYSQGKSPWYPLDRRLGGSQNRSGRSGEEKNLQPLLGLEPPIIQPILFMGGEIGVVICDLSERDEVRRDVNCSGQCVSGVTWLDRPPYLYRTLWVPPPPHITLSLRYVKPVASRNIPQIPSHSPNL